MNFTSYLIRTDEQMFTANDPEAVRRMYSNDESLRIRQDTHDKYGVPAIDFAGWSLDNLKWNGYESILDVGCGPGRWYHAIQKKFPQASYYGIDLFPGMIARHPARSRLALADAQRIPFPDETFDVVMANHMLFHVPDIDRALREFRRVLKPDGTVMATTNSIHNMPELQQIIRRAITLLAPPGTTSIRVPGQAADLFSLESGTRMLSRHFYAVVRYDLPRTLVFQSVDPVLAYLDSTRSVREAELPDGVSWDDVMVIVREQITRLVEHFGELVINSLTGLLVATDRGDFIHDYLDAEAAVRERTKPAKPRRKR